MAPADFDYSSAALGGLRVVSGNRLEDLADRLAGMLRQAPLPPLVPEVVLVQNPGLGRWLSLELARRNLGCAHVRFALPNAFLHEMFAAAAPQSTDVEESPYSPWAMAWRIMEALPGFLESPAFTEIARYLEDDPQGRRRFGLSQRIAQAFDRYLLFRPAMILNWDQGRAGHWQALLWRAISRDYPALHRPALRQELFRALDRGDALPASFPQRISFFGAWAMPPFHLDVLARAAQRIPVHLYHVNPCREFWPDIVSGRQVARLAAASRGRNTEDLHLDQGNPLLSSMGGVGRDFFNFLTGLQVDPEEIFSEPARDALLGRIQHQILDMKPPEEMPFENGQGDGSLLIQSCHGPMREMEVLHNHILRFLETDPGLEPHHIVVMAPDIDLYAPYIEAVFSNPGPGGARVPFAISRKSLGANSPAVDAFLALFPLCRGRFDAVSVLDFAGLAPVARQFGFSENCLATLTRWTAQTRTCWGSGPEGRQTLGLPPTAANTWQSGMDRLLLGYAMGGGGQLFGDILPYSGMAVEDGPLLGRFASLLEALFELSRAFAGQWTMEQWGEILEKALEQFIPPDLPDRPALAAAIAKTARAGRDWGFSGTVGAGVAQASLSGLLEQPAASMGILSRGVTFCSIREGAGLPFSVVCLVGMDDGAFPRRDTAPGFDYMARNPLPGDRSAQADDRFSFLQSLLSARKRLYISYAGQSAQDNQTLCPSPLVSELADYVEAVTGSAGLLTLHKLQAFDPSYYDGSHPGLFSYSRELCQAARACRAPGKKSWAFFGDPLPPLDIQEDLPLDRLCRFFQLPVKFLLRERLGVYLEWEGSLVETSEPFGLGGLEKYELASMLLDYGLAGKNPADLLALVRAEGRLPHGAMGDLEFRKLQGGLTPFIEEVRRRLARPRAVDARVMARGRHVAGRLYPVGEKGLFLHRPTAIKAKDRLVAWIRHLALCLAEPDTGLQTFFAGTDQLLRYEPLEPAKAAEHLETLVRLHDKGLCEPLTFFPETSMAYAEAVLKNKEPSQALGDALKQWEPTYGKSGESDNPYCVQCFARLRLDAGDFAENALAVCGPLLEQERKGGA